MNPAWIIMRELQHEKHEWTRGRRARDLVGPAEWMKGVEYGLSIAIRIAQAKRAHRDKKSVSFSDRNE